MGVEVLDAAVGLRAESGRWEASATGESAREVGGGEDADGAEVDGVEADAMEDAWAERPGGGGLSLQS